MVRRALLRSAVAVLLLTILPGCHVLVRLGERAEREPAPAKETERRRPETVVPPSSGPEAPPVPGLETPPAPALETPPAPGLKDARSELRRLPSVESTAKTREPKANRRPYSSSTTRDRRMSTQQLWTVRSRLSGNTGINTNTAIAPGEGQTVYRTQLRYLQAHSSPGATERNVNVLVSPQVLAYGLREDLSLFGVVPLVKRDGTVRPATPAGAFTELDDFGVADLRFFAKYRFCEQDEPGQTTRWSLFGGLEVPTYDKHFSSDSWDPFLGTVWTYQSLEWGLDLDWFWNFNTGNGLFEYDEMRYDAAYTYVLLTGKTLDEKVWQVNSVFELNGSYVADGSHLVFLAPGFQLALERMIVEGSVQLPVIRDLKNALEPDAVLVIGTRITW